MPSLGLDNIKGDVRHVVDLSPGTQQTLIILAVLYVVGQAVKAITNRR